MWKFEARFLISVCLLLCCQTPSLLFLTVVKAEAREVADSNIRKLQSPASHDCGPQALRVICRTFGLDISIDELADLAGMDETGTTMGGLFKAAERKGLMPEAVKLTVMEGVLEHVIRLNNVDYVWIYRARSEEDL